MKHEKAIVISEKEKRAAIRKIKKQLAERKLREAPKKT